MHRHTMHAQKILLIYVKFQYFTYLIGLSSLLRRCSGPSLEATEMGESAIDVCESGELMSCIGWVKDVSTCIALLDFGGGVLLDDDGAAETTAIMRRDIHPTKTKDQNIFCNFSFSCTLSAQIFA